MDDSSITRRRYIAGAAGLLATAGCLGEGSGNNSRLNTPSEPPGDGAVDTSGGLTPESNGDLAPATTASADSLSTPVRGDPDADVTVSTYEDFACPHCRNYSLDVQPKVVKQFAEPGKIRYERYDFPIPVDEKWSWAAASAARGVQAKAGSDAFWEYADLLYENQGQFSYDRLADLAGKVGVDGKWTRRAARTGVYRPVVEADRKRGRKRGVTGTPTIFVNGRSVEQTFDQIRQAIEDELGSSG